MRKLDDVKRLLNEPVAPLLHQLFDLFVQTVAAHQQNLNIGIDAFEPFVGVFSVHFRHDHIQGDQIRFIFLVELYGFLTAHGGQYRIPEFFEHQFFNLDGALFIFNQQNFFLPLQQLRTFLDCFFGFFIGGRQVDIESGAVTEFTVNPDDAAVIFNDAICRRKSQAGAFTDLFCCEKRLENSLDDVIADSDTGIRNRRLDVVAWPDLIGLAVILTQIYVFSLDEQIAPIGHGMPGV